MSASKQERAVQERIRVSEAIGRSFGRVLSEMLHTIYPEIECREGRCASKQERLEAARVELIVALRALKEADRAWYVAIRSWYEADRARYEAERKVRTIEGEP